jgi:sugar lactone lactonase YvrE
VAGTGVAGNGLSQFNGPNTILVDLNGYMYIADEDNGRIMRWEPGAFIGECIAGCSGTPGAAANQLDHPGSIAFDSSGSMYVNDWGNNRVQKFQILDEISKKLIY